MAVIAHSLKARGHDVVMTSCTGSFRRCTAKLGRTGAMEDLGDRICADCRGDLVRQAMAIDLPLLPIECFEDVGLDREIDERLDSCPGDLIRFVHDGARLGQMAAADLYRAFKTYPSMPLPPGAQSYFREALHTVVKTYTLAKAAITACRIDRVLVHGESGPALAVLRAAANEGVPTRIVSLSTHGGEDRRHLSITDLGSQNHHVSLARAWPQWSRVPLTPAMVATVAEDFQARYPSKPVDDQAPPREVAPDIRQTLGLRADRKTIVVFPRSPDELFAQWAADEGLGLPLPRPNLLFPDQLAWLADLLTMAGKRQDFQFVIRIDPREGPNRRDGIRSAQLEPLEALLGRAPSNVKVIGPQDDISNVDLLDAADLVMSSWGPLGLDAARLGVPVVSPFQSLSGCPTGDFIVMPASDGAYRAAIGAMVALPLDLFNVRQAYRWYHTSRFAASVPVGDAFPDPDPEAPFRAKVLDRIDAIERILQETEPPEPKLLAAALASPATPQDWHREEEAVRAALSQAVLYFMTGSWPDEPVVLYRASGADEPGAAMLTSRAGICTLTWRGTRYTKFSRLVERLGWALPI
jgi:hypothetical protein